MLQIDNTIISLDIIEQKFKCNLEKCYGACCLHGDSGAPLEEEEKQILKKIFSKIKPYLPEKNLRILKKEGLFYKDQEGDWVTTLIEGKQCAFSLQVNNIYFCSIEKAYIERKIDFQKPLSCHLYPIRIKEYNDFVAVNYNEWEICQPARCQGNDENIRLFEFLKDSLERKFGKEWYKKLENNANEYFKRRK